MKDIHSFVIIAEGENDNLEECIKSIKKQSVKTNVLLITDNENDFVMDIASEYGLGVMIYHEDEMMNKYNFALTCVSTELVTIVNQNDIYDRNYAKEVLKVYKNNPKASLIFTNCYEIFKDKKNIRNKRLFKRRMMVKWLKYSKFNNKKYFKKLALKYFNALYPSSVTYVTSNLPHPFFEDYSIYNEWVSYNKLVGDNLAWVYIETPLVAYRSDALVDSKENTLLKKQIYKLFWPNWLIDFIYRKEYGNETIEKN